MIDSPPGCDTPWPLHASRGVAKTFCMINLAESEKRSTVVELINLRFIIHLRRRQYSSAFPVAIPPSPSSLDFSPPPEPHPADL